MYYALGGGGGRGVCAARAEARKARRPGGMSVGLSRRWGSYNTVHALALPCSVLDRRPALEWRPIAK